MRSNLFNLLDGQLSVLTFETLLLNFTVALIIGFMIFISYRVSFSGDVYSSRFNVSLLMLTMVTTIVMNVIGHNIALSLGMVGALSIVRFRTAVKDPRDTAYIFWCIAVGVCCGVSDYLIAATGSAIVFVLLLFIGRATRNERYLLILRCSETASEKAAQTVLRYFEGKARLRVTNTTRSTSEYIYEISEHVMKSKKDNKSITTVLYEVEGIDTVNIVCQNDEINR